MSLQNVDCLMTPLILFRFYCKLRYYMFHKYSLNLANVQKLRKLFMKHTLLYINARPVFKCLLFIVIIIYYVLSMFLLLKHAGWKFFGVQVKDKLKRLDIFLLLGFRIIIYHVKKKLTCFWLNLISLDFLHFGLIMSS